MEINMGFHGVPFKNNVSVMKRNTDSCNNCMFFKKVMFPGGENGIKCGFTDSIIYYGDKFPDGLISNKCEFDKKITKESFISLGFKVISNNDNWYNFRNNKCDIFINLGKDYSNLVGIHSRGNSFVGNCHIKANNLPELEVLLKSLNII